MYFNIYNKILVLFCAIICSASSAFSQSDFFFENPNDSKDKLHFEFVHNLMIIPVTINGVELSFLLDTGVENTILFSLEERDSLELKSTSSINLRGLGKGEGMRAFRSKNNQVEIGKAISKNFTLYVIFNSEINLSQYLGIPVHGIIGYDFFKNFIVEVNYVREFIKFYAPLDYDEKCRNCSIAPLYFFHKNPYMKTEVVVLGDSLDLMMLIDSGASDALWLFPDDKIKVPNYYFKDFLGLGLSGSIYGKRSKIEKFSMGDYEFKNITTAFPDSTAFGVLKEHLLKDGLIGAEILKRFDLVIDYPNKQISFKPNRFFDNPFYYDMSGLVIKYRGVQVIEDFEYVPVEKMYQGVDPNAEPYIEQKKLYKVKFRVLPQMKIIEVQPGSPAFEAGLKKGDILMRVNGKEIHHFTLAELAQLFSSEEGKRIKIKIRRDGEEVVSRFRLEKMLKKNASSFSEGISKE